MTGSRTLSLTYTFQPELDQGRPHRAIQDRRGEYVEGFANDTCFGRNRGCTNITKDEKKYGIKRVWEVLFKREIWLQKKKENYKSCNSPLLLQGEEVHLKRIKPKPTTEMGQCRGKAVAVALEEITVCSDTSLMSFPLKVCFWIYGSEEKRFE